MRRIAYIVLFLCMGACALWAEDRKKPAYQIEDNTFFDPTRKEVKAQDYAFSVDYRLEVGFAQHEQRTHRISYPNMFLNGVRLGASFTFNLPMNFGIQTGVLYTLLYGTNDQHWRSTDAPSVQPEYIRHRVLAHNFTIPIRAYYTIPVWKKLNIFFFTGPQLHICAAENDYMKTHLSDGAKAWLDGQGIPTSSYDRMDKELVRANIQWGLGTGLEWDKYRVQGGYDFGLNNLVKHKQTPKQYMSEWGWYVTFGYKF